MLFDQKVKLLLLPLMLLLPLLLLGGNIQKSEIAHQRCCTYALESRSEPCNR